MRAKKSAEMEPPQAMPTAKHLAGPRLAVLSVCLLLGACSARPFVVEQPSEAWALLQAERPTAVAERDVYEYNPDPRPISLCYSSQLNNQREVMDRARSLCPYNGRLVFHSEDSLVNGCSLLQPNRVTFICTPGPQPPSPYE